MKLHRLALRDLWPSPSTPAFLKPLDPPELRRAQRGPAPELDGAANIRFLGKRGRPLACAHDKAAACAVEAFAKQRRLTASLLDESALLYGAARALLP